MECSGSIERALDWGSKGLLVLDSPPAESLCCDKLCLQFIESYCKRLILKSL